MELDTVNKEMLKYYWEVDAGADNLYTSIGSLQDAGRRLFLNKNNGVTVVKGSDSFIKRIYLAIAYNLSVVYSPEQLNIYYINCGRDSVDLEGYLCELPAYRESECSIVKHKLLSIDIPENSDRKIVLLFSGIVNLSGSHLVWVTEAIRSLSKKAYVILDNYVYENHGYVITSSNEDNEFVTDIKLNAFLNVTRVYPICADEWCNCCKVFQEDLI